MNEPDDDYLFKQFESTLFADDNCNIINNEIVKLEKKFMESLDEKQKQMFLKYDELKSNQEIIQIQIALKMNFRY